MQSELSRLSWGKRTPWVSSLLNITIVLLALVIVPLSYWFSLPLIVCIYVMGITRWIPTWLQWVLVFLLSAHLAVLGDWWWGVSLALLSTTVASTHLELRDHFMWLHRSRDVCLGITWVLIAGLNFGTNFWWQGNLVLVVLMIFWEVYQQEK